MATSLTGKIPVYIVQDGEISYQAQAEKLFYHHTFFIMHPYIPNNTMYPDDESHYFYYILQDASQQYPTMPFLFIKDTSVSHADTKTIATLVQNMINVPDFDIGYLSLWLDNCDDYRTISAEDHLYQTFSPHGLQAVLITPRGRDILLGKALMPNKQTFTLNNKNIGQRITEEIMAHQLKALCFSPTLINFDIIKAEDHQSYIKTQTCHESKAQQLISTLERRGEVSSYTLGVWGVILLLVIIILIFLLKRR